jgi:AcrR family transcriptional regulator
MSGRTGLREQKKTATRRAISDAALTLAVERGPSAVTVEDIAAGAGVSPRTVFNYFPSKEAAILGLGPENRAELVERLETRPISEPPLVALRNAMPTTPEDRFDVWRSRARLASDHPNLQSAFIAGFARLEDDLTLAMAERLGLDPVTDLFPRLVVNVALTSMRVAVNRAIDQQGIDAVNEAIDEAFAAVAAGLPAPSHRRARTPARTGS